MSTLTNLKRYLLVGLMAVTLATSVVQTAAAVIAPESPKTIQCGGPKNDSGQETHG